MNLFLPPVRKSSAMLALGLSSLLLACGDSDSNASVDAAADLDATGNADAADPDANSSANPVNWAPFNLGASLSADDFYIDVGGERFTAPANVVVGGNPGDASGMTLEIEWPEHGKEMRLHVYFTSDGTDWWSNEIRTDNGQNMSDWTFYTAERFRMPLGSAFTGNVTIESDDGEAFPGTVYFQGLNIEAFKDL